MKRLETLFNKPKHNKESKETYYIIDGKIVSSRDRYKSTSNKINDTNKIKDKPKNKIINYYIINGEQVRGDTYKEAYENYTKNKNNNTIKNSDNTDDKSRQSKKVDKAKVNKKKDKTKPKKQSKFNIETTIKNRIDKIKADMALNKEKIQLINNWKSIMAHRGKYNNAYDSYEIVHEVKTNYGWKFKVYAPDGLALKDLESVKPAIESNIGCIFMYEIASSNKYANCRIIFEEQVKCNEIPFEPVKVKPYEVYPGLQVTGEPLVIDSIAAPHVLLAGGTRRGKNGSADSILLSWLDSCTEKEIELYLFQCAKVDLIKYRDCKQVKCCVVGDFKEMLDIIEYVVETEIKRRLKLFEPMFKQRKGENIYDYNKLNPHNQLPYCWLIFDEFLELMLQSKAKKEENNIKNEILGHIERVAQMGAAVGVQYMIIHQKPEKALCPTFIKNMSNIRICFGFEDESCGRIVLGDRDGDLVVNLPPRRAYVNNNGAMELIFTTNLKDRRDMYIRPYEVDYKQDILDKIRLFKNSTQKPDEGKINKVNKRTNTINTVKQDAGTALLPTLTIPKSKIRQIDAKKEHIKVEKEQPKIEKESIKVEKDTTKVTEVVQEEIFKSDKELEVRQDIKGGSMIKNKTNNLEPDIDKIIAENIKRIPGFVPYEPKEGDKKPSLNEVTRGRGHINK